MALLKTSSSSEQNSVLSTIDGLITILEKYPDNKCQQDESKINPFEFLVEVLKRLDTTENELIEWLVNFVKITLPIIELGVKGILLMNLRNLISCSVDPHIPAYARDPQRGLTFKISEFDTSGILQTSPLDTIGSLAYFGIPEDENASPYNFLRPIDFNTFLWYVIHRGRYSSPSVITANTENEYKTGENSFTGKFNASQVNGESILMPTQIKYNDDNINCGIICGSSFRQNINGIVLKNLSVCTKIERNEETKKILFNQLFPVSTSYKTTNYYVNRKMYFYNLSEYYDDKVLKRDYAHDIALCNFEYIGNFESNKTLNDTSYMNNTMKIVIPPKPLVHIPQVGQSLLAIRKISYNSKGEKSAIFGGTYSVIADGKCQTDLDDIETLYKKAKSKDEEEKNKSFQKEHYWWYNLKYNNDENNLSPYILVLNSQGDYWIQYSSQEKNKSNELTGYNILPLLQECYPNLTLYEFNYDYIMSMRLFDSKVVISQLIAQLMQFKLNLKFGIRTTLVGEQNRLVSIVENLVNSQDSEISDCFYSFSNDKYDEMIRNSELQRANLIPFGNDDTIEINEHLKDISDILNEFGDAKTNNESIEIFSRLIRKIDATIIPGSDGHFKTEFLYPKGRDILTQFLTNLMQILINALLSPKVLLMLLINKRLCETDPTSNIMTLSPEQLLKDLTGLVIQIVKEMRDLILKEYLKFVFSKLEIILGLLLQRLVLEQAEAYRRLIRQLLDTCWFHFGKSGEIPTEIDKVNYADIDETLSQPSSPKC